MYKISVKIDGIERRKRTTGILHVIAGLFLVINAGSYVRHLESNQILLAVPVYVAALIAIGYGFFRKRIDPKANYNHWVRVFEFMSFTGLGIALYNHINWISVAGLFLWSVVILLLMFTERKVFHDTDLVIREDGIHVPGYFSNHILPWHLVDDFVLREDYLSIFRTNKKFVQLELLEDIDKQKAADIILYCKKQIEANQTVTIQDS